jgi:hypothetical protein
VNYLKRFWAVFLSLVGLAGVYLTFREVGGDNWQWVFLAFVGAAGLVAAWKLFLEVATRVRNYPALLNRAADLEERLTRAEERSSDLEANLVKRYEEGVEEGQLRVFGSLAAFQVPAPRLTAISTSTGTLTLIGRFDERRVPVGSRWVVEVVETGEQLGKVQAVALDDERRNVHLTVIEREHREFWNGLERRAHSDPTPPPGVRLVQAKYALPAAAQTPPVPDGLLTTSTNDEDEEDPS